MCVIFSFSFFVYNHAQLTIWKMLLYLILFYVCVWVYRQFTWVHLQTNWLSTRLIKRYRFSLSIYPIFFFTMDTCMCVYSCSLCTHIHIGTRCSTVKTIAIFIFFSSEAYFISSYRVNVSIIWDRITIGSAYFVLFLSLYIFMYYVVENMIVWPRKYYDHMRKMKEKRIIHRHTAKKRRFRENWLLIWITKPNYHHIHILSYTHTLKTNNKRYR